jgi:hypothetical protein
LRRKKVLLSLGEGGEREGEGGEREREREGERGEGGERGERGGGVKVISYHKWAKIGTCVKENPKQALGHHPFVNHQVYTSLSHTFSHFLLLSLFFISFLSLLLPSHAMGLSLHRNIQKCAKKSEEKQTPRSMAPPKFLFFSGGTALNSIEPVFKIFTESVYILPISDNGGSSSVIMDVIGGPSIGDIF